MHTLICSKCHREVFIPGYKVYLRDSGFVSLEGRPTSLICARCNKAYFIDFDNEVVEEEDEH